LLDIKHIISNLEDYKKGIAKKNHPTDGLLKAVKTYEERNVLLTNLENLRAEQNKLAKDLPKAPQEEKKEMIEKMSKLKKEIKESAEKEEILSSELKGLLCSLPNPAHESVLAGKGEEGNKVIRHFGEKPVFDFEPKHHAELGKDLDLIDTEAGAKVAGARFHFLKNELVLLQFALVQYAFEIIMKHGFSPILPPFMVNQKSAYGTGFLDSGHEEEVYHINPGRDDLYLIGTSEVPNTAYMANEIIPEKELPLRIVAYSSCFRREAGSGGKDTKGILRCHQFDKIEMGVFANPDSSWDEHKLLLKIEEEIWQGLGIHYQLMDICGGDLGGPAAKKYDIEAWMPGQNAYREVTSTSNCTDFQARRLNIRVKRENGKNEILHTLNGTGIAIGRCLIAIMENFQTKEGEIMMPEALKKWLNFEKINK
jgi:seryl-tRNA synthetase